MEKENPSQHCGGLFFVVQRGSTWFKIRMQLFVPYFSGLIDFLWQIRDNYDGAIRQESRATEVS